MIMRKPFVMGNWKMNTDSNASVNLARDIANGSADVASHVVDVAVCPPFVYLQSVAKALSSTTISLGAQDIYFEQNGAFTGEISVTMLKDVGCFYPLCGQDPTNIHRGANGFLWRDSDMQGALHISGAGTPLP